jgi:hypothetical protein
MLNLFLWGQSNRAVPWGRGRELCKKLGQRSPRNNPGWWVPAAVTDALRDGTLFGLKKTLCQDSY